nr:complex I subunit 5 family protein [bacterium]
MEGTALFLPILIPSLAAAVVFALPERMRGLRDGLFVSAGLANLFAVLRLMRGDISFSAPWASKWFEFSLLATPYAKFTIAAAAAIVFLIVIYTAAFMKGKSSSKGFAALTLFTLGFVNGAVLADNLIVFLFFWEGLMLPLFGMIAMGGRDSFRTAIKAFVINGVADLCMMVGIVIVMMLAGTATISQIKLQTAGILPGAAFLLMLAGALAKAGCMPFHSWIPDAAKDAPLPFMALFPGAIEKLLGIYLVARLSFDIFSLEAASYISTVMMVVGSATILLAVLMALIQKDFKRLLSFHAISQVGYMVLGIGTATPVGIVGGIFHMFNNAIYKSCLFLAGGAVERQAGTTDLRKLGGLARK